MGKDLSQQLLGNKRGLNKKYCGSRSKDLKLGNIFKNFVKKIVSYFSFPDYQKVSKQLL